MQKVAIIGIGLMGGSLGLALKSRRLAHEIWGVSRHAESCELALALNLVDRAGTELAPAIENADFIVLASPLSTYRSVTEHCAPYVKKGAIMTDLGSVKHAPTRDVLTALPPSLRSYFVPGHPIAGTEKSGPSAALPTLYEGKKVILTPLPDTAPGAVSTVTALWKATGAQVEIMQATRHDFIYATVSHVIQLVSSCYGVALARSGQLANIALLADAPYRSFVRLCGSDVTMWRDIFMVNHAPLQMVVEGVLLRLASFGHELRAGEWPMLCGRLTQAQQKRLGFEQLLENHPSNLAPLSYPNMPWMALLPKLIAACVMEGIAEPEYPYATGSGLHGLTRPLLHSQIEQGYMEHAAETARAVDAFTSVLQQALQAIESRDASAMTALLQEGQAIYAALA